MENFQDHEVSKDQGSTEIEEIGDSDILNQGKENIIPTILHACSSDSFPKVQYVNTGDSTCKYEYVLLGQYVEEGNKIIWRINHKPSKRIYLVETDEVMKRLDVLGKMHIKESASIIFSAGMKCILQEAEMKKKLELVN